MGAGLAKQIRDKYPIVYKEYINYLNKYRKSKCLGTWQLITVEKGKHVANLFGQYDYGRGEQYTDYESLRSALFGLVKVAEEFNKSIAIPYGIGCGLGGGQWEEVYKIIEDVFRNYDVTIYKIN